MSLFDRYGKLRKALSSGRVHTEQKEMLKLLRGRVTASDLPALIVEPAGVEDLRMVLRFAVEKRLKVALNHGLPPISVKNQAGHLLILTTRLAGAVEFRPSRGTALVESGVPVQSLAIDLARSGKRWLPLWPEPTGATIGELLCSGWEGFRSWSRGGTITQIRNIHWMSYDGVLYSSAAETATPSAPDVSGLIFGSHGEFGMILSAELLLAEVPSSRLLALFQCPDDHTALGMITEVAGFSPAPEAVVYWNETATSILRDGTDGIVSPDARTLVAVEWSEELNWQKGWSEFGELVTEESVVNRLWQDLLRYERIAARLYPESSGLRLRLPASALPDVADAARQLSRNSNLPVVLWGTVECGAMRVQVLQPDDEPRTRREALEVLTELSEAAASFGAAPVRGERFPVKQSAGDGSSIPGRIEQLLRERCDPHAIAAMTE